MLSFTLKLYNFSGPPSVRHLQIWDTINRPHRVLKIVWNSQCNPCTEFWQPDAFPRPHKVDQQQLETNKHHPLPSFWSRILFFSWFSQTLKLDMRRMLNKIWLIISKWLVSYKCIMDGRQSTTFWGRVNVIISQKSIF